MFQGTGSSVGKSLICAAVCRILNDDGYTVMPYKSQNMAGDPAFTGARTVLLDCLTVLITNQMMDTGLDFDTVPASAVWDLEEAIAAQITTCLDLCADKETIVVANELGLGLVPAYRMGSFFRDIAGRINQMVAARADDVYFCVSGIPMKIK